MSNTLLTDEISKSECTNSSVTTTTCSKSRNQRRKRNRSKKSGTIQSQEITNNIVNNTENLENLSSHQLEASNEIQINKPKRKRKKKKPKSSTVEPETGIKCENLLSKTFEDSRRNSSSDSSKNLKENQKDISQSNKDDKSINLFIDNSFNENLNMDTKKTTQMSGKSPNLTESGRKILSNSPKTATSNSINQSKSESATRDEILAQRKAKKLSKQLKSKDKTNESNDNTTKLNVNSPKKEQQNPTINKLETKITSPELSNKKVGEQKLVKEKESEIKNPLKTINSKTMSVEKQTNVKSTTPLEKSREQILAEREAKKLAKQAAKNKTKDISITQDKSQNPAVVVPKNISSQKVAATTESHVQNTQVIAGKDENKKKVTTKAERRAIQEAQREAKAKILVEKQQTASVKQKEQKSDQQETEKDKNLSKMKSSPTSSIKGVAKLDFRVKLFNHLYGAVKEQNKFVNHPDVHPVMVRLGEQYIKRIVVGSNARCIAFLNALKTVIKDFDTPPKKEFGRVLEANIKSCINYLHKCRPLAVSIMNAHKYIKILLTQLPSDHPENELKEHLLQSIDDYIKDQIEKAAQAINGAVQEKISDGDVILTYGCSSLINRILEEALHRGVSFRVICVSSRPFMEGHEMLRRLVSIGISCTCVLINAIGFIMPEVTKVLLGAHSILANGYVMSRTGTAQVALVARSYNVPVLVCCETHKFSERVQTDAIVYNELGNPDDVIKLPQTQTLTKQQQTKSQQLPMFPSSSSSCNEYKSLNNWRTISKLIPLNLNYDITPPELVTAVVTEVAILPCTSVPVILRIKPTEIGY